ncbi:MAG: hypothetical protein ACSHXK_13975 [Oceanococcus sp.]
MAREYVNYVCISLSDDSNLGDPKSVIPLWVEKLDEDGAEDGFDTRYDRKSFGYDEFSEAFLFETRGGPGHQAALVLMRMFPGSKVHLTWMSDDDCDCDEEEYAE